MEPSSLQIELALYYNYVLEKYNKDPANKDQQIKDFSFTPKHFEIDGSFAEDGKTSLKFGLGKKEANGEIHKDDTLIGAFPNLLSKATFPIIDKLIKYQNCENPYIANELVTITEPYNGTLKESESGGKLNSEF